MEVAKEMQQSQELAIVQTPIEELRPDPANPRRISDQELDALTRSIREFGLVDPIIARRDDKTIIGGHQRLIVARRLGLNQVPVVFLDLSPERARLLNLGLNRIGGNWDQELLARMLAELKEVPDVDLSLSGFSEDELKKYLKSLESREKRDRLEPFDLEAALEAARAAPVAHTGDLWRLGDHRLLCGDATQVCDVARLVGETRASMAFTDPPYNVSYGSHGGARQTGRRRGIQNDDLGEGFYDFLVSACQNLLSFTEGSVYVCMSSSELHTLQRAFVAARGHWSTFVIWAKDTFTLGRSDYQRQYEPILYGWREGARHHWCGDRDQGDVWQFNKPVTSPLHPTMKPVPLVQRAIENSSQLGDVVLDLFLGSGSTLIGCERTGRVCYGMELAPEYVDVAVMRWEAFTGEKVVREEEE
jgi:DNA modification methylase